MISDDHRCGLAGFFQGGFNKQLAMVKALGSFCCSAFGRTLMMRGCLRLLVCVLFSGKRMKDLYRHANVLSLTLGSDMATGCNRLAVDTLSPCTYF